MSGKLRIPHCLGPLSRNGYLVHRSKVGSIVAGCIGAHLAREKVKSAEHALSWSLDFKHLSLPLPLTVIQMINLTNLLSVIYRKTLSIHVVFWTYYLMCKNSTTSKMINAAHIHLVSSISSHEITGDKLQNMQWY